MQLILKDKKRVIQINTEQVLMNISRHLAEENLISREEQIKMVKRIEEQYGRSRYERE